LSGMLDWMVVRPSPRPLRSCLREYGAPSIAMGVTPHLAFDETCSLRP
jgi:hypothetical protein